MFINRSINFLAVLGLPLSLLQNKIATEKGYASFRAFMDEEKLPLDKKLELITEIVEEAHARFFADFKLPAEPAQSLGIFEKRDDIVCPKCGEPHVDKDEWAKRLHKKHLCEKCGEIFQPHEHYTFGINKSEMSAQAKQAVKDGEVHFCKKCDKVQPIELTFFNPDTDTEPSLIVCLVCREAIDFIENM